MEELSIKGNPGSWWSRYKTDLSIARRSRCRYTRTPGNGLDTRYGVSGHRQDEQEAGKNDEDRISHTGYFGAWFLFISFLLSGKKKHE
jgi:hypothetical protein